MMLRGASWSGDFSFHLVSWMDAQRSMALGVLDPHWASSPNLGAGEPRFMFYPPLTWVAGALLGLLMPWSAAPVAFVFVLLAATGMAVWRLARENLDEGPATLAGYAAIFFGYALFAAYKRSAYAELSGGFWIPLLLLLLLRRRNPDGGLWRSALDGSAAPLALVLAGAWLSNGPVGLMGCYLMAAVAGAAGMLERSWAPVVRAAVAGAVGLGLTAVYLLPAAWEQRWASLRYAVTESRYRVENSWMFARHADRNLFAHDVLLRQVSWVGAAMLGLTLASVVIAWKRGTLPGGRAWWIPLALIPCAVLFLQLPVSEFVWKIAPRLEWLQFPWRWLLVVEAPMGIFFAAAVWPRGPRWRWAAIAVCAAAFVGISAAAGHSWWMDSQSHEARIVDDFYTGMGEGGVHEYAPPGVHGDVIDLRLPNTCLLEREPDASGHPAPSFAPNHYFESNRCTGHFDTAFYAPEHKRIQGIADRAGYLVVRLRSYPAWRVTLNGNPIAAAAEHDYGLIAVPVEAGKVEVAIDWITTGDVIAGRWISVAFLVLLTVVWQLERKLRRAPLS
jgi:hypothetical protein